MRRRILPIDAFLCLFISAIIAMGTGHIAGRLAEKNYEKELEEHQAVDGDIGGKADENAFRAQSIDDLLSHDTFTIVSPGIQYRNEGGGFYDGFYFYNVALPNGERVAARVNTESVQTTEDSIYSGDSILPVGCVVWDDLTQSEGFLEQIEYRDSLTRKDFFVDMVGNTAVMDEEQALETPKLVVQVLTVFICYPILHTLGAMIGIFPPYFSFLRKKRE